jgi:tRNA uridine 5-carboxymethylaminomethyl modification enzyme
VREVDALDGVMGRTIDEASIHFRMLNRRKGAAVWGPRSQADRDLYRSNMQLNIKNTPNLEVVEASVEDIDIDHVLLEQCNGHLLEQVGSGDGGGGERSSKSIIRGVITADGGYIKCNRVVITTGTFLRGKIYLGKKSYFAGRHIRDSNSDEEEVEPPSIGLAITLMDKLKFPLQRLKTGTPPRLDARTINYDILEPQNSENPYKPFSYMNSNRLYGREHSGAGKTIQCHKTYTNEATHKVVTDNLHLLPTYDGGNGGGVGPRYCPSIVKKVERFPERLQHMVWLEPEG